MKKLYGTLRHETGGMLVSPAHTDKTAVILKPGCGYLRRGTVLYRDTGGMYAPAREDMIMPGRTFMILDEDADTGSRITPNTSGRAAAVWRSGTFTDEMLFVRPGEFETVYYTDENGNVLLDENGTELTEEETR